MVKEWLSRMDSTMNEYEANLAIEEVEAGNLKVTDVLLGDEIFGDGLFPYLYEEAGGWVLFQNSCRFRLSQADHRASLSPDYSISGAERM
jgi:hypothetical protein